MGGGSGGDFPKLVIPKVGVRPQALCGPFMSVHKYIPSKGKRRKGKPIWHVASPGYTFRIKQETE